MEYSAVVEVHPHHVSLIEIQGTVTEEIGGSQITRHYTFTPSELRSIPPVDLEAAWTLAHHFATSTGEPAKEVWKAVFQAYRGAPRRLEELLMKHGYQHICQLPPAKRFDALAHEMTRDLFA